MSESKRNVVVRVNRDGIKGDDYKQRQRLRATPRVLVHSHTIRSQKLKLMRTPDGTMFARPMTQAEVDAAKLVEELPEQ